MRCLPDNLLQRLNPAHLDSDLAAGTPPEASPRHAARANLLVTPGTRHALAASWERLLLRSHVPVGGLSNRAPVCRERIRHAEPEIRELIAALRATDPIPARGVAIATRFLTDGCGSIYNSKAPDDLAATIALAIEHLNGFVRRPMTPDIDRPNKAAPRRMVEVLSNRGRSE